jgi:hypothetical protein
LEQDVQDIVNVLQQELGALLVLVVYAVAQVVENQAADSA